MMRKTSRWCESDVHRMSVDMEFSLSSFFLFLDFTIILSSYQPLAGRESGKFFGVNWMWNVSHTTDKLYLLVFTQHSDFLWTHTFASVMDFSIIITNDREKTRFDSKSHLPIDLTSPTNEKHLNSTLRNLAQLPTFWLRFFWSHKQKTSHERFGEWRKLRKLTKKKWNCNRRNKTRGEKTVRNCITQLSLKCVRLRIGEFQFHFGKWRDTQTIQWRRDNTNRANSRLQHPVCEAILSCLLLACQLQLHKWADWEIAAQSKRAKEWNDSGEECAHREGSSARWCATMTMTDLNW